MKSLKEWAELQELGAMPLATPTAPPTHNLAGMSRTAMAKDAWKDVQASSARGAEGLYKAMQSLIAIAQQKPTALTRIVTSIQAGVGQLNDPELDKAVENLRSQLMQLSTSGAAVGTSG